MRPQRQELTYESLIKMRSRTKVRILVFAVLSGFAAVCVYLMTDGRYGAELTGDAPKSQSIFVPKIELNSVAPESAPLSAGGGPGEKLSEAAPTKYQAVTAALAKGEYVGMLKAHRLLGDCFGYINTRDFIATSIATGGANGISKGGPDGARVAAMNRLTAECRDFDSVGKKRSAELLSSLKERISKIESGDVKQVARSRAEAMLNSGNPAVVADGLQDALPLLSPSLGAGKELDEQVADLAILLAGCNLGDDCSETGWKMTVMCVTEGQCGKRWDVYLTEGLSSDNARRVRYLGEQIAGMVMRGELRKLDDATLEKLIAIYAKN
jgi:hypothetical protein